MKNNFFHLTLVTGSLLLLLASCQWVSCCHINSQDNLDIREKELQKGDSFDESTTTTQAPGGQNGGQEEAAWRTWTRKIAIICVIIILIYMFFAYLRPFLKKHNLWIFPWKYCPC